MLLGGREHRKAVPTCRPCDRLPWEAVDTQPGHGSLPWAPRKHYQPWWRHSWACPSWPHKVRVPLQHRTIGAGVRLQTPSCFIQGSSPHLAPQAWLPSCPSLMVSSLSPPSRFPETTHQATVCPLSLMLESCPPLTALARASVQSLLGSHKGLLRKWRPREGERLREVTQPCLPGHGASGHSATGWGTGSAVH